VVLAGGTGGAKLARGMLDVAGEDLVVVANPGDDIEIYGAYVSPDPDLISFWLGDRIDERGWGLAGDTFTVMDGLREVGVDVWFNLGDRDLAIGLERARLLQTGASLTEAHTQIMRALGVPGRVLPATDQPLRSRVRSGGRWWGLQEFMIRRRGEPVEDVRFAGAGVAPATPAVLEALARARAIIVGPSNPVISIGPILAVAGLRQAIVTSPAPVVAVSPLVGGEVIKGPTAEFMRWAGRPLSGEGVTGVYGDLLDGLVADRPAEGPPKLLETDVRLDTPQRRRAVAERTLRFADSLAAPGSRGSGSKAGDPR
jgi:LPPG:FO 2-phospho-L-lactate transferase